MGKFDGDDTDKTNNDGSRQWGRILSSFRAEYGEATYQRWLARSWVARIKGNTAEIAVADKQSCKHIEETYGKRLLKLWQSENRLIEKLKFIYLPAKGARAGAAAKSSNGIHSGGIHSKQKSKHEDLNPHMTFDNFIVGKSNELAYKAARAIAEGKADYSPLYIHGSYGLGKTHLLHAICHATKLNHVLLSADKFVKRYVKAVRDKENGEFDGLFEGIDLLLIDDIHIIAGKKKSETELSNIIGRLRDSGCRLAVASILPPYKTENMNPGLSSRLSGGLTAEILQMDKDMAISFSRQKMKAWGLEIPQEVLDYIGNHLPPDKRALESCLNALKGRARLLKSPITPAMIQPIMKDFVARRPLGNPTIKSIQEAVCKEYEITMNEMKSPRRHKRIVVPRQIAMYLCKQLTTRSLPEIASKFGGRDHTTVIHACKKIDTEMGKDPALQEAVQLLIGRLKR